MASDRPARLQIHEHLDFQRRFRVFRLCGTAALVLLLLVAMSGLLGSGPLASSRVSAGLMEVDHPRFLHRRNPDWFEVRVDAGHGPVELVLEGALVEEFDLDAVTPTPEQAVRADGRLLLRLAPGTSTVRLQLTPRRMGSAEGHVRAGADSARLRMFVYP